MSSQCAKSVAAKKDIQLMWDKIASGLDFKEPDIRIVDVDGVPFRLLLLPRSIGYINQIAVLETGLSFFVRPRIAGYRYRFVLIPRDNLVDDSPNKRWFPSIEDISDWVLWANAMDYIVSMSTFLSGAGVPWGIHAQSIPLYMNKERGNICLSVLGDVATQALVPFGGMPWFQEIEISRLERYPAPGLKIEGRDSDEGFKQAVQKTWELALNYAQFKAFNLVILPSKGLSSQIYFFPRRKDGIATWGKNRWQIAAMEMMGLLPSKSEDVFKSLDESTIKDIFHQTCLTEKEFSEFLKLIKTF